MNVTLPDGTVIEDVPEGITKSQLMARLAKLDAKTRQDAAYKRALGEERQKMMDERSLLDNIRAGFGGSLYDTARGAGQILGINSQEEIDQAKRLDAPMKESGGGITGNVLGQIAQSLAPMGAARGLAAIPGKVGQIVEALPGANTVIGGAALGGTMGALQPTATGESRFGNTVLGTIAGGILPAGVAAYRAGKAAIVDPITQAGRDRIAGRMMNDFAADPQAALARLQSAASDIPGVRPMVSEATLDPGLATLERSMHNFPGPMQDALRHRLAGNNAARQQFLEALGGTPDDLTTAATARGAAFEASKKALQQIEADVPTSRTVNLIDRLLASPNAENDLMRGTLTTLRDRFFEPYPAAERLKEAGRIIRDAVDRAHKRGLNADDVEALEAARRAVLGAGRKLGDTDPSKHANLVADALDTVYSVTTKTRGAQGAVQEVANLLGAQDVAFKRDPARLMEIYREINRIKDRLKLDNAPDVMTDKALNAVKRSLSNAIDKATREEARAAGVGTFKEANRAYAEASKKMDAMKIIQSVKERASGNKPDVSVTPGGMIDVGERPLRPSEFLGLVRPDRQASVAKQATKGRGGPFERYLDETQMKGMTALEKDIARAAAAADRGKAQGSPTAQFLYAQNLLRQSLGPVGLPVSWADKAINAMSSAPFIGAPLSAANRFAGRGLAEHVAEAMGDPQRAAQLMQAANQAQVRALNPGVTRYLPPTLAAIASGMFGSRQLPQEEPPYGARW